MAINTSKELISFFKTQKICYGSCILSYVNGKKKPTYTKNWQNNEPFYDENKNGFYIVTGKKSNLCVLDIDRLDNEYALHIKNECDKYCNMVAKTKKGFHYYFEYDTRLLQSTCAQIGVDCRSDNGNIFCEPCWYIDDNKNKYEYKFITLPKSRINRIPESLIKYYLNVTNSSIKNKTIKSAPKDAFLQLEKKCARDEVKKIPRISIDNNEEVEYIKNLLNNDPQYTVILFEILTDIILGLNVNRNNNYNQWVQIGMVLVKFGQNGISLWKQFSKMSENYNESEINYKIKTLSNVNGLTFFSLLYWLKQDNILKYNDLLLKYKNFFEYVNLVRTAQYLEIEEILNVSKYDVSIYLSKKLEKYLICNNNEKNYYWDLEKGCWTLISRSHFAIIIVRFLKQLLQDEINRIILLIEKDPNNEIILKKKASLYFLYKRYGDDKYCENFINGICFELRNETDIIFDANPHVVNFKNGIYELKTGIFRRRVRDDFIIKYLDYDYNKPNINIITEIKQKILNISNDDNEIYEFNLDWFGYCLTGETKEQICNFYIGYSAANGKSSLAKMFHYAFPIYTVDLDRATFISGNQKSHKFLCDLDIPTRFAYIEELEQKNLDVNKIKNIVTASSFKNEVMFGTSKDINIHAKLTFISNFDPKFVSDNGIKRRGVMQILKNRFLPQNELSECCETQGVYLKDDQFDIKFKSTEYKLALFYIFAERAKIYLETSKLHIPKKCRLIFKELCCENDKVAEFIDEFCEITKNDNDIIHKDDFLDNYNTMKRENLKWPDILSKVKAYVDYNRDKRHEGRKGCLIGIKFVDNLE